MIYLKVEDDGRVSARYKSRVAGVEGLTTFDELPPFPELDENQTAILVVKDGILAYALQELPEPSFTDPTQEVEPIDPSEERRKAYVAEADPHLIASLGYEIEGDTVRAEEEAQAYLAAKSAIRERYPDELA